MILISKYQEVYLWFGSGSGVGDLLLGCLVDDSFVEKPPHLVYTKPSAKTFALLFFVQWFVIIGGGGSILWVLQEIACTTLPPFRFCSEQNMAAQKIIVKENCFIQSKQQFAVKTNSVLRDAISVQCFDAFVLTVLGPGVRSKRGGGLVLTHHSPAFLRG